MLVSGVYGDAENALNTYSTYNEGIKVSNALQLVQNIALVSRDH